MINQETLEKKEPSISGKSALIIGPDNSLRTAIQDRLRLEGVRYVVCENSSQLSQELGQLDIVVNLTGSIAQTQELLVKSGRIVNSGGSIVNLVFDPEELKNFKTENARSVSIESSGVIALGKSLAWELSEKQIRVNTLCLGPVDTNEFRALIPQGMTMEKILPHRTLPRLPTVADITNAVVFFASDESSYITAQAFPIRDIPKY